MEVDSRPGGFDIASAGGPESGLVDPKNAKFGSRSLALAAMILPGQESSRAADTPWLPKFVLAEFSALPPICGCRPASCFGRLIR